MQTLAVSVRFLSVSYLQQTNKQAEKLKSCKMKDGWMKNDEGWMKNDDFKLLRGFALRLMDERTDMCKSRVAFAAEKGD